MHRILTRLLAALVVAALVLPACDVGGRTERVAEERAATETPTADTRTAFELRAGDCLNDPQGLARSLGEVAVVACDTAHELEVFAVLEHDDGAYPGDAALARFAGRQCGGERFRRYVGVPKADSELLVVHAAPTSRTWSQGDREIVCLLHLGDEPLTGSMRGARR